MNDNSKFDEETIDKLAKMSNLTLSTIQNQEMFSKFSETLDYISNLNELNLSEKEPHRQKIDSVMFPDGIENKRKLTKEEVFQNQSQKSFSVPKVL